MEWLKTAAGHDFLDKVYDDIYNMNTAEGGINRTYATKAYKFLLSSFRSFTVVELARAVSVLNDGSIDDEVTPEYVLSITSNLIVEDVLSHEAKIVHDSATEYLERRKDGCLLEYSSFQNHTQVADSCLALLINLDNSLFANQDLMKNLHREYVRDYPGSGTGFASYSIIYWAQHCQKGKQGDFSHTFDPRLLDFSAGGLQRLTGGSH